jgi:serine phosphatase RsbU (regulator of sigma subunit)
MARLRGLGTVRRELAARVARDLLFRVCDGTGAWVCPFSERAVPEINLYRLGWKPETRDRILEYLLSPACPGHYSKWKTDKTAEALKRAVERASVERAETISLQAADLERDNLKRHLTLLRQSLSAQAVKTHTKAIRAAQRAMLPSRTPVIPRYDVGVLYEPGALLGGNFWHVFRAGPGCTGFVVGDVPEAGPGAAETMSAVLRCFQLRAAGCSSPAALLLKVNMDLAGELRRGQRATVFCAILDHTTSLVRCARAAHAPAVLAEAESCSLLPLRGGGKALGGADAEGFAKALQEYEVTIPPGGVLLLQTPGATAARNGAGKAFGEGQLDTALLVCAAYSPRSLLKYVKAVLEEHLSDEPHEDDVTLLAVKRLR